MNRKLRLRSRLTWPATILLLFAGVIALECARERSTPARARGVVLISLSGLRADALGSYGRRPSQSPFLDHLAEQAVVYEQAVTTSPGTLAAHVSLLSGLYPAEHGVRAPTGVLSADVAVIPERLSDNGFRTAGFTDGGYLSADFGFDRGFDEFEVSRRKGRSPFERAIRFLREVEGDPFFIFLQSDALEDSILELPATQDGAGLELPAIDLRRVMSGNEPLTPEISARIESEYLAALARLDRTVAAFFGELERLELLERTVVVVTADHGFEFGEHGRIGHSQIYPETFSVPLLVAGPGVKPLRIRSLVQTVDIAPTLSALAGLDGSAMVNLSGVVLPGFGEPGEPRRWAVAEAHGRWEQTTLLLEAEGTLMQGLRSRLRGEHDGTWVTRQVTFDTVADRLDVSIVSFRRPRIVEVVVDGEVWAEVDAGVEWAERSLSLPRPGERKRVSLRTGECESPSDLGEGSDRRCLSFKLRGQDLSRFELFDLGSDSQAREDASSLRTALAERMQSEMDGIRWRSAPSPETTKPRPQTLRAITVRGEYPEPPRR